MRGAIVKQRGSSKNHILAHSKHVGRIRALIKKAPARKNAVEISDAILTVATATSVLCHHRKSVDFSITFVGAFFLAQASRLYKQEAREVLV
jgi:hypothetical protein